MAGTAKVLLEHLRFDLVHLMKKLAQTFLVLFARLDFFAVTFVLQLLPDP